jgi:hypothetical protein
MPRIKITDISKSQKITREEMKKVMGGYSIQKRNPSFLTNPWVLGAVVATAIAIPLAIDDTDDGS